MVKKNPPNHPMACINTSVVPVTENCCIVPQIVEKCQFSTKLTDYNPCEASMMETSSPRKDASPEWKGVWIRKRAGSECMGITDRKEEIGGHHIRSIAENLP